MLDIGNILSGPALYEAPFLVKVFFGVLAGSLPSLKLRSLSFAYFAAEVRMLYMKVLIW